MTSSFAEYLDTVPDAPWCIRPDPGYDPHDYNHQTHHIHDTSNGPDSHEELHQEHQQFQEPLDLEPVTNQLLVSNLQTTTTKKSIEGVFSKFGIIRKIVINKDAQDIPDTTAMVYFAIAPFNSSFGGKPLVIDGNLIGTRFLPVDDKPDTKPEDTDTDKPATNSSYCKAQTVSMGAFTRPTTYQEKWKTNRLVRLTIDTQYQTLEVGFMYCGLTYKLDFPWSNLTKEITMETTAQNTTAFTFSLRHPPRLWRQVLDHKLGTTYWTRSTEMYIDPALEPDEPSPLTLNTPASQVDIGSWTDYRLEFLAKEVATPQFEFVVKQLMNHDLLRHTLVYQRSTAISVVSGRKSKSCYNHADRAAALDFDTLYMLECAITKRYLNQYTLDATFYERLNQLGVSITCRILSWIIAENTAKYNAMAAFQSAWKSIKKSSITTIPDGCCMVSSALVTPTTMILLPPAMEQTSRTLRQYIKYADRFLRVSFVEEDLTLLTQTLPRDLKQRMHHRQEALYDRLYKVMKNGIKIGNRLYDFLAYDSTQLSCHTCWFFASTTTLSASDIRKTLWNMDSVTTLAEYIDAADICFQATQPVAINESTGHDDEAMEQQQQQRQKAQKQVKKRGGRRQRPSQQERKQQYQQPEEEDKTIEWIDDLYTLSGKVRHISGKISPKAIREVAQTLQLENTPSAIQYSLGGCLGVLGVSNFINGKTKIQVRPCHYIFDKKPFDLQVVQPSSYAPAFLDRTLMSLLSALGVSSHLFLTMVQQAIAMMNSAFSDPTTATEYLKTFASNERNEIQTMRNMISAGFLSRHDPFLLNMLWIFRTKRLIDMKKNAALHVAKGAHLMVIVDETDTLMPNEVFCQISDLKSGQLSKRKQVKGPCFVVKQPCIHTGNIRIFEAVDHPALRHWYDVIVISSKYRDDAPRQHLDGKMDGQRFTIIWDPVMQPYSRLAKTLNNREPDDQPTALAKKRMTPTAAIQSFVNYVHNDCKDTLIRHYLMTTEKAGCNAKDSSSIQLALQYADATDYTNIPCSISIDRSLESDNYPDYMEVPDMPTHQSTDIQGQIYRMISPTLYETYIDQMLLKNSNFVIYDPRLKVDGMEPYIIEAREVKNKYDDDLRTLMQQYGVNTEVELVSGSVVDDSRQHYGDQRSRAIFRERMMQAMEALQRHYLHVFDQEFNSGVVDDPTRPPLDQPPTTTTTFRRPDSKNNKKEIKAAAWYYVTYHPSERPKQASATIFLSFPWLVSDILCSVARRQLNAMDDTALDAASIEKYRKQSDGMRITVDDEEDEGDESDESDESEEGGSDEDSDDDSDAEPGPKKEQDHHGSTAAATAAATMDEQTYQLPQQDDINDEQDSVPTITMKLSDIIGL